MSVLREFFLAKLVGGSLQGNKTAVYTFDIFRPFYVILVFVLVLAMRLIILILVPTSRGWCCVPTNQRSQPSSFPSSASGVTFISVVSHSELVGWMLEVMVEMVVEVVEDKELLD